jgi:hypothetical protein
MYQSQLTPQNSATLQPLIDTLQQFRARMRNSPDTPDGPVPPLAALAPRAGSVAAAQTGLDVDDPALPPLRPIPMVLLELMAEETNCCGKMLPIEELLRLLDESPDMEEAFP